jgi:hypothetical protein
MKPLKLSGACGVVAAVVAMAVAAPAQADARSLTAPVAPTIVPPLSLDPLENAEVAAVAQLGIPLPRAREAVAVQSAVEREDLVNRLEAALGAGFGGVWYAPAAAQLDVGVTSSSSASIAEAVAVRAGLGSSVTEVPVRSSSAELAATQNALDRSLAGLRAREEVSTQASAQDNTVYVNLGSAVPPGDRAAIESEASETLAQVVVSSASRRNLGVRPEARCKVFKAMEAYCDPTIVGGATLEEAVGPECTIGPAVLPPKSTETYILTAGHCVEEVGEKFFSLNKAGTKTEEIGKAVAYLEGEIKEDNVDVAAIKVENEFWRQPGEIPVIPAIALWNEKAENEPFKVKGQAAPVENAATCISGQKTGFHCGTIKKVKLALGTLKELVEVEIGKEPNTAGGDSGGPWFTKEERMVQGVHTGKNPVSKLPVYEDLAFALKRLKEVSALELELLTEANEKRM